LDPGNVGKKGHGNLSERRDFKNYVRSLEMTRNLLVESLAIAQWSGRWERDHFPSENCIGKAYEKRILWNLLDFQGGKFRYTGMVVRETKVIDSPSQNVSVLVHWTSPN